MRRSSCLHRPGLPATLFLALGLLGLLGLAGAANATAPCVLGDLFSADG